MQTKTGQWIAEQRQGVLPDDVEVKPSWNIAPTSTVPILMETLTEGAEISREVRTARWGLLPHWAKDQKLSYKTFNARSETVTEKPTFRSAVRRQRCAVPATAYYEWYKPQGGGKIPHAVIPDDDSQILFAGLWETWTEPATGALVPSCTILTGPAPDPAMQEDLYWLHDRTPLALNEDTAAEWMRPDDLSKPQAAELVDHIRAASPDVTEHWMVYEIDKAVGHVRNNDPTLLQPVSLNAGPSWTAQDS